MVLGGMPSDQVCDSLRQAFIKKGISSDRLSFYLQTKMHDYLALHRLVDVCLDTVPYAGGSTTSHALWMGAPTLTMTGDTLPGRVGATILGHAELHDFIAQNQTEFLQNGIALASQLDHLAALRSGMRMRKSALGQPALIAPALIPHCDRSGNVGALACRLSRLTLIRHKVHSANARPACSRCMT